MFTQNMQEISQTFYATGGDAGKREGNFLVQIPKKFLN